YFGIAFVRLLVYSFDFSVPFYLYCNKIAPTDTYALSLHDALPISPVRAQAARARSGSGTSDQGEPGPGGARQRGRGAAGGDPCRSEEHTSELQSRFDLVCRLLLEKKKIKQHEHKSQHT